MPVYLKNRFDPSWSGYPPHMSKEDFQIFQRVKTILFQDAVNIYYDVGLPGATEIPQDITPELQKMWETVTNKRIDVLVETPTAWNIIELRPRATSTAAGRLLQYKDLWTQDPPDTKPIILIVATDTPDPDLPQLLKTLDIQLIRTP